MKSNEYNDVSKQSENRPRLLTVLCVLSFISLGFSALGILFSLIGGKPSADAIEQTYLRSLQNVSELRSRNMEGLASFFEQSAALAKYQQENYWQVMASNILVTTVGFLGVLYMLKGRKLGFHLYIWYSLLSVGISFLIIPSSMVQVPTVVMGLVLSGFFVFLYSKNLAWMNK